MGAGCVSDRGRVCRSNRRAPAPALDVKYIDIDIHSRTSIEYRSDNRVTEHPAATDGHHVHDVHNNRRDCDDDVN